MLYVLKISPCDPHSFRQKNRPKIWYNKKKSYLCSDIFVRGSNACWDSSLFYTMQEKNHKSKKTKLWQ